MKYSRLIEAAKTARLNAYAPYSHFLVGAAVEFSDGTIFCGCNVENSSYGGTCCAERVALFAGVSEGKREVTAVAVVGAAEGGDTAKPCYPCGICRQVLSEFATADTLFVFGDGSSVPFGELLPYGFELEK